MGKNEILMWFLTLCFAAFSENIVIENNLPRISIPQRSLHLAENDGKDRVIDTITYADFDFDGRREKFYGYVIQDLAYDVILDKPWMKHNYVVYLSQEKAICFGNMKGGLVIRELGWYEEKYPAEIKEQIKYAALAKRVNRLEIKTLMTRARKQVAYIIFAITMHDINRALEIKPSQTLDEIKEKLPSEIKHWSELFEDDRSDSLPPHRKSDMKINLHKDDKGRENPIPWGPLYKMSRDELLVLRKTLSDHFEKGWIRESPSSGGAPVLFVRKPGNGLRFCVDYRALNAVTEKDRYPLPLIRETLRLISKSTWITKVDV